MSNPLVSVFGTHSGDEHREGNGEWAQWHEWISKISYLQFFGSVRVDAEPVEASKRSLA
jgi:hypothetical protein